MLSLIVLTAITLWLLYKLWISPYKYWELNGFPFIPGVFPFGSSKSLVTLTRYQGFTIQKMYNDMAIHPYFGIYVARNPALVLRDPEIIRIVMVKEFSHFRDRQSFKRSPKEFLAQHLFNLDGDKWRALRIKITPTFTSGKLKAMFPLFVNCSEALDNLLLSKMDSIVDVKDIASSFTLDTICSCAFGLDVNALKNPDSKFKKLGVYIFKTTLLFKIKAAIVNYFPEITKIFKPSFSSKSSEKFLLNTIVDTVEYREKNGYKRNDFLDLLIQLKHQGEEVKNESKENNVLPFDITYEMMTAQCYVFFSAGFETSSSVQSYCLFEMAMNPDIQERVHAEIVKTIDMHGGLTYQAIMDMEYLDMVISETMRKYPTLPLLTRCCTKDFTLPSGHKVHEGDKIIIPVYALHHDPAYFPKPDVFDPERFSHENKELTKPYTYLPFGEGPRICIGMRFGLLQTKMGLITVLRKYRVEETDLTQVPVPLIGSSLVTTTAVPIKLKLCKRNV